MLEDLAVCLILAQHYWRKTIKKFDDTMNDIWGLHILAFAPSLS